MSRALNFSHIHRRSGYSLAHISKIFNGKRRPSLTAAREIALVMGITLDQLFKDLDRIGKKRRKVA